MERTPVASSNLASVGYDAETKTLEVAFKHGGVYQYANVEEATYQGLMSAGSHGQYFDRVIKKGGYSFRKVG